ncbi:hypothetical protein Btru_069903 [Bulinus truncatus]|nr:hypothetical protein Btru_069903 [Bulinus truncatus]
MTKGIAVYHYVGLGFLILGNILHIVGLATPGWAVSADYQYLNIQTFGLWKKCEVICVDINPIYYSVQLIASCALSILGMILGIVALTLAVVHVVSKKMDKNYNCLPKANYFFTIMSFLIIAATVACYAFGVGIPYNYDTVRFFGYSFYLSIAGGVFILISGIVFNCCCSSSNESNE